MRPHKKKLHDAPFEVLLNWTALKAAATHDSNCVDLMADLELNVVSKYILKAKKAIKNEVREQLS